MGVRWIIGRAGTGKTAACAREIRTEMQRDPLGGALLWVVPEQATFMAERLLLAGSGRDASNGPVGGPGEPGIPESRGTFRAQVLSFRRLALLIGRELGIVGDGGGRAGKPMDEVARAVLLEEMVREKRGELTVFGSVADRPGFIQKLDGMLRELRQHGHTAASLRAVIETGGLDVVMQRKVWDLAILMEGWNGVVEARDDLGTLGSGILDFEQVMAAAAARTGESAIIAGGSSGAGEKLEGARIWVDGLSAMSGLEMQLLAALGRHAQETTITLLADPDAAAMVDMRGMRPSGAAQNDDTHGLFARTERLHRRLTDLFRQKQVRITETIALRKNFRFADTDLQILEAELWSEEPRTTTHEFTGHGPRITDHDSRLTTPAPHAGVDLWECSDPETEVHVVAQAIRDLVVGSGAKTTGGNPHTLRYRQIGIIVPDMEGYADALRRVLSEHGIPHFIDARRGLGHHPLVELLRSIVAIAQSGWDREDLLLYMKTRLAGISEEQAAWVENYIIEHGITRVPWSEPWTWIAPNITEEDAEENVPASARERLKQVNAVREKVWNDLRAWWHVAQAAAKSALKNPRRPIQEVANAPGPDWADALITLLAKLGVEEKVRVWAQSARENDQIELALMHEQAWREVEQLLAVLRGILAGKQRTLAEFQRLLSTALESLTLALIPPTVDQVLVSSVTRSRVPELDVVFLVGAVEGQFPKVVEEDPILSDAQREVFNTTADPIGEGSDRQLLEMPFFDYVALTRAGRRLVMSFPLADRRGRALGASRYVARLRDLLPGQIREAKFDAASRTQVNRIGTTEDLLTAVAAWAHREMGTTRQKTKCENDAEWEGAYNWLTTSGGAQLKDALSLVWRSIREKPQPHLGESLARRFYPPDSPLRMSVSQLEKFAACPLQYFMHFTLGLRLRQEFALDAMNLGVFYHRILERVYRRIIAGDIAWPHCEASALGALLEQEVDAAAEELHAELARRMPGYQRVCARTKRTLGIVLEADRRRASAGDMRPRGVEIHFGYGHNVASASENLGKKGAARTLNLPLLAIHTPARHEVHVRGKIDRVDVSATGSEEASVTDYKSSSQKKLELDQVLWGLSLQLPLYAQVISRVGGYPPAAALYFGLGVSRQAVKHRGQAGDPESDEFYQQFQPHGIIDQTLATHLDAAVGESKESPWFKMKFKKDGAPAAASELLSHDDFAAVLDFAAWKIGALADQLMGGQIAPAPYRKDKFSPCIDCEFASLCPFDRLNGAYRELPKLGKIAAVARMREEMATSG